MATAATAAINHQIRSRGMRILNHPVIAAEPGRLPLAADVIDLDNYV
jgi:hypothetical protein